MGIADDVLRDVYVRGKYRDVILPMVVIRRLDAVLEPTKPAVLKMKAVLDEIGAVDQRAALKKESGQAFYNSSPFTLRDLKSRTKVQQLKADFEAYLDGFSPNVQEILEKFKFRNQIQTVVDADILGILIEKFLDHKVNLSPEPVYDNEGNIRLPGLDNHAMGTIFEELIRKFNEENNEEAGEHFTPRDVVKLMTELIFRPIADDIQDGTYTVYDGACGTGGMLTIAEESLKQLGAEHNKRVSVRLFGQEVNPETYAITKADLMLKGQGEDADSFSYGSTLSADGFPAREFDFMLSNPPYGKSWKNDLDKMGGKGDIKDPRFSVHHNGQELSLLTRSSDGQLMFLVNKLAKMKANTPLGSRIAEVHNGSALFTGDAGQGESNIRRWILENDWLEAIIALPLNMFYNTGIATYIWVLANRKPENRKGKVQLIDATPWFRPLRKNLGKKNCELAPEHIHAIVDAFQNFEETEQSKIFPNKAFGYWKVTVERPLRLSAQITPERAQICADACLASHELLLRSFIENLAVAIGQTRYMDSNLFFAHVAKIAKEAKFKLTAKHRQLLRQAFCIKDENAEPVIKSALLSSKSSKPIFGCYEAHQDGQRVLLEFEPDPDLRDHENVPLLEDGGIEAFIRREVLPHTSDAWVDADKTQIGYEISFTRYFYKPKPMRTLEEIRRDIEALELETDGLLSEVLMEVNDVGHH